AGSAARAQGRRQGGLGRGAGGQAAHGSEGDLMGAVAVLLETTASAVRSTSLPAVTAARQLAQHHGGPVVALVLGAGGAAADAAHYADKVWSYDAAGLEAPLAETWAPVVAAAVKKLGATA